MKKTALLFSPMFWKHGWDFVSALAWEAAHGYHWSSQKAHRGGGEVWGEVSVEQLYEKICNKSQSNFYFSCAFSVWMCWSLLKKCLDPCASCGCWVLANSVHAYGCVDLAAPAVPKPWPWSEAVLGWWHYASMWAFSSPPGGNQGLPRKLTRAQISLPPWSWELEEPSWLLSLDRPKENPRLFGYSNEGKPCAGGGDFCNFRISALRVTKN